MILSKETPVVVAGGASGLGQAVAKTFTDLGLPVGILDMQAPTMALPFAQCDVTDPVSVGEGLAILRSEHGQERICVNCAGIAPAAKTVSRVTPHDPTLFAKVIGINLLGTFNVASQSAAGMAAAEPLNGDGERGVIINTASIAAFEGQMGQAAYASSKAGVAGLTLPIARDLAKVGVRVMSVAPGIFATPMVTAFSQEVQEALAQSSEFPPKTG